MGSSKPYRKAAYTNWPTRREGRIHLWCPKCGRKASNMPRARWDPKRAVIAVVWCPECGANGIAEGPDAYLYANGNICPFKAGA